LVSFGILPLVFADPADHDRIAEGDTLRLPGIRQAVSDGATEIQIEAGDRKIVGLLDISGRQREILLAGGVLNHARQSVQ
jgi:aconitate hydratase